MHGEWEPREGEGYWYHSGIQRNVWRLYRFESDGLFRFRIRSRENWREDTDGSIADIVCWLETNGATATWRWLPFTRKWKHHIAHSPPVLVYWFLFLAVVAWFVLGAVLLKRDIVKLFKRVKARP